MSAVGMYDGRRLPTNTVADKRNVPVTDHYGGGTMVFVIQLCCDYMNLNREKYKLHKYYRSRARSNAMSHLTAPQISIVHILEINAAQIVQKSTSIVDFRLTLIVFKCFNAD